MVISVAVGVVVVAVVEVVVTNVHCKALFFPYHSRSHHRRFKSFGARR